MFQFEESNPNVILTGGPYDGKTLYVNPKITGFHLPARFPDNDSEEIKDSIYEYTYRNNSKGLQIFKFEGWRNE
jgi:hypothetical protein